MLDKNILECLHKKDFSIMQRTLTAVVYTVLTVIGLTVDVLLLVIYYRLRTTVGALIINKMNVSLTVSAIIMLSVNVYVMIPCTFTYCECYNTDIKIIAATSVLTFGYYTTLFTNSLIAIERISLFTSRRITQFIANYHKLLIGIPWIVGFLLTISTELNGCYKRFNRWTMKYTFDCGNCLINDVDLRKIMYFTTQIVVVMMLFGYVGVLINVCGQKWLANKQTTLKSTLSLIMQPFALCGLQWLSGEVFHDAEITNANSVSAALLSNGLLIGNNSINAIVSICVSKQIKSSIRELFNGKNGETRITPVTNLHVIK